MNKEIICKSNIFGTYCYNANSSFYHSVCDEMAKANCKYYNPCERTAVVHGYWKKLCEDMPIFVCSVCNTRNLFKNGNNVFSNYCPECGAKMDEVK